MNNTFEMKDEYDMSQAKRGAVVPSQPNQTRITIRIDTDILDWFRTQLDKTGGGSYQTLINHILRQYVDNQTESLEKLLRRIIQEEFEARLSIQVAMQRQ